MNISNCRVIIADDSILKAMDIRRALEWNGIRDITIVSDQEKLWDAVYAGRENGAEVGLIVTDVHYPLAPGAEADGEAGFKLIERMKQEGIKIPIIICSSQNYCAAEALGSVWYREKDDIKLAFREVLGRLPS